MLISDMEPQDRRIVISEHTSGIQKSIVLALRELSNVSQESILAAARDVYPSLPVEYSQPDPSEIRAILNWETIFAAITVEPLKLWIWSNTHR